MRTIRAAVIPSAGAPVEIREIPEPELERDSALLAIERSEVCGTDVHLQAGRLDATPFPFIPGHVSVGRLEKIHGRMADVDGVEFAEGDRVTFLDVHRTCNGCWQCLVAKATTRCPARKVYGITYGLADGLTGGWAEALYLKPGTRVLRLDGVDPDQFMAGGCALPTALHALERAEIRIGDTVLVLGAGPVGLSALILARRSGAGRVLCLGAPERRLAVARELGAETLDMTAHDEAARRDWILSRTCGRGADVTIEASGDPRAVVQALRWTRDAGRAVIAGQYTDHGEVPFNPHLDLNRKHLDVRGCWGSDYSHFHRAVQVMSDPATAGEWEAIPLGRYDLDQTNEALAAVASGSVVKALIVP
jgi:L-iditol 2-dehydrogenase